MKARVPTLTQAFDIISQEKHYRAFAGRCGHKPLKTQSQWEFCWEFSQDMTTDSRQI